MKKCPHAKFLKRDIIQRLTYVGQKIEEEECTADNLKSLLLAPKKVNYPIAL